MKFVDETMSTVESGDGGNGCVSFRREKYVPRGGPDGGAGGDGGDVILKATPRKRTLYDFHFKRHFKAENGRHGQGKQKTGRKGKDLIIEIPPGTLIVEADSGNLLADLVRPGDAFVAARGGRGGLGNTRYKSSTNRAPRASRPGETGCMVQLKLELKLIADVGLVGLPNAGKSTLIGAISSARPKTAAYPFTTLSPSLGVVHTEWSEPFVVADIPGLIEGAADGVGLGIQFLKHLQRTRLLLHIIDVMPDASADSAVVSARKILRELERYDESLYRKPRWLVLNKLDLVPPDERQSVIDEITGGLDWSGPVHAISALNREGVEPLCHDIMKFLENDESL